MKKIIKTSTFGLIFLLSSNANAQSSDLKKWTSCGTGAVIGGLAGNIAGDVVSKKLGSKFGFGKKAVKKSATALGGVAGCAIANKLSATDNANIETTDVAAIQTEQPVRKSWTENGETKSYNSRSRRLSIDEYAFKEPVSAGAECFQVDGELTTDSGSAKSTQYKCREGDGELKNVAVF